MTASQSPGEDQTSSIRVGDVERNAAVTALGEHMTTGRLDLDEYGTRSAVANSARTVGELRALFTDLPAPHPQLPGVQPTAVRPAFVARVADSSGAVACNDDRSRAQKFVAAAAGAAGIIAVVLFIVTKQWYWFLLIPLISTIAGSIWGDSWKHPDKRR